MDKITIGTSLIAATGLLVATDADGAKKHKTDDRPNVVLIIADDCRMLDLGCYGSPDSKTPHIDRIASEGLAFDNFFQAAPTSSPTRHCLLTGIYPVRSGAYPNHTFIEEWVRTAPEYLKEAGYRVATQGKRHYAPIDQFPFEYLDGIDDEGRSIRASNIEPFLADAAKTGEPFFLYVCSHEPHSPWNLGDQSLWTPEELTLPPNLVDTPQTRKAFRNYLAEINHLDNQVGQVDALIRKYGLNDNTIFIFTSEQGYSFPFAKWTCYDEGVRTGFVVRWPGVIEPGRRANAMCEYVDVVPTLIDIAGGKDPGDLDGRSFLSVLKGETDGHKSEVYAQHTSRGIYSGPEYYGTRMVRDERFTYIINFTPEATFKNTSTSGPVWESWKNAAKTDAFARRQVYRYQHRPGEELYDNHADPFQNRNLAREAAYSGEKARLAKLLNDWMVQQGDKGQQTEMEAYKHMAGKMNIK